MDDIISEYNRFYSYFDIPNSELDFVCYNYDTEYNMEDNFNSEDECYSENENIAPIENNIISIEAKPIMDKPIINDSDINQIKPKKSFDLININFIPKKKML